MLRFKDRSTFESSLRLLPGIMMSPDFLVVGLQSRFITFENHFR